MKTKHFTLVLAIFLMVALNSSIIACTTFTISNDSGIVFGRNFDFPIAKGHIHINKRNQLKTAFMPPPELALQWISKYGSISFNQAGKEFPYGGMNEAGLVIEQMWLEETEYPVKDKRFCLSDLQWIQYQLDVSTTVNEVIASDSLVRISNQGFSKLHFLVTDAKGNTAVIEFLDGKMKVCMDKELAYTVLANCPYERSVKYRKAIKNDTKELFNDWTKNSSGRFAKAVDMINEYDGKADLNKYAFAILDSVSQGPSTQWSIVYNLTERMIYYKTSEYRTIQMINFDAFDYSCKAGSVFIEITAANSPGNNIQKYTFDKNIAMIEFVTGNVEFLKGNVPQEHIVASARYPESIICRQ